MLDASVTLSWFFADEVNEYADRVLATVEFNQVVVPAVWALEIANGLARGERRGRISPDKVARAIEDALALRVSVRPHSVGDTLGIVLDIARRYQLSSYDAAYLHVAMRESLPLATQDGPLRVAAEQAGLAVFDPA